MINPFVSQYNDIENFPQLDDNFWKIDTERVTENSVEKMYSDNDDIDDTYSFLYSNQDISTNQDIDISMEDASLSNKSELQEMYNNQSQVEDESMHSSFNNPLELSIDTIARVNPTHMSPESVQTWCQFKTIEDNEIIHHSDGADRIFDQSSPIFDSDSPKRSPPQLLTQTPTQQNKSNIQHLIEESPRQEGAPTDISFISPIGPTTNNSSTPNSGLRMTTPQFMKYNDQLAGSPGFVSPSPIALTSPAPRIQVSTPQQSENRKSSVAKRLFHYDYEEHAI
eukprot:gb/GECH01002904.1/.p1 GENE.gb/GECH01002904.1/~~gb/GECH01002904.1/.p1  ORF type:complete len:281 (+),score=40.73 gb/GECH01002904.1/:1-843(+)